LLKKKEGSILTIFNYHISGAETQGEHRPDRYSLTVVFALTDQIWNNITQLEHSEQTRRNMLELVHSFGTCKRLPLHCLQWTFSHVMEFEYELSVAHIIVFLNVLLLSIFCGVIQVIIYHYKSVLRQGL